MPPPLASAAVALVAASAIAGTAPGSKRAASTEPGGQELRLRTRRLQGAQMVGGAPPKEVEMALCDIGTVFAKLSEIKSNAHCTAGCAGGTGNCGDPSQWYPGRADRCSAECGKVFEPFWDQCGEMLVSAGMGGMGEMSIFCALPGTHDLFAQRFEA